MEARQAYPRQSVSKSFVAVVLVSIAIGLGVMGAYVAKDVNGGAAAATQSQSAATQHPRLLRPAAGLRQDNDYPVLATAKPQRALPIRPS